MTEIDLIRKNILLDKLESDLAIEKAALEIIKSRIDNMEQNDGGFLATNIRNMHWLQQHICEAKIKEIEKQLADLKEKIK